MDGWISFGRRKRGKETFASAKRSNTYKDATANDGVDIRKVACDGILRCIEECHGERSYQDGHIEIRHPS
jgi:hypothetical protein